MAMNSATHIILVGYITLEYKYAFFRRTWQIHLYHTGRTLLPGGGRGGGCGLKWGGGGIRGISLNSPFFIFHIFNYMIRMHAPPRSKSFMIRDGTTCTVYRHAFSRTGQSGRPSGKLAQLTERRF